MSAEIVEKASVPAATGGLVINGLRLEVEISGHDIVDEVHLTVPGGQILGLVGESGSGKTTVGLAVLAHARRGVRIAGGQITCDGIDVLSLNAEEIRAVRGGHVAYVPQDPSSSLNPAIRIRSQLREVLEVHNFGGSDAARTARITEMMGEVLLPSDDEFLARYPHQLSGGQQQRVALAMSFACRPSVIVLDEPTTGLDVSTQAHVLQTIRSLAAMHNVAALYITHDLAVVADLADEVAVMYAGRVVEHGPTRQIFSRPVHPYTRHLVAAAPDIGGEQAIRGLSGRAPAPGRRPQGCAFALRCELANEACRSAFPPVTTVGENHRVRCFRAAEIVQLAEEPAKTPSPSRGGPPVLRLENVNAGYQGNTVVHGVTFDVHQGECVALVGESGSGKTTLARAIGGLHHEWTGDIFLDNDSLATNARKRTNRQRMKMQYVFQNPYSSLNPRRSIGESVLRPLLLMGVNRADGEREVNRMLELVSLTASYAHQYPNQLSGGERQRVAIARALVCVPDVLVCDEITSALDVLVQAAIVELLGSLRKELGLSLLFVTHNLPLVRSIADTVAVMNAGSIVELGPTEAVIGSPQQEYTQRLISDTPSIEASRSGTAR